MPKSTVLHLLQSCDLLNGLSFRDGLLDAFLGRQFFVDCVEGSLDDAKQFTIKEHNLGVHNFPMTVYSKWKFPSQFTNTFDSCLIP